MAFKHAGPRADGIQVLLPFFYPSPVIDFEVSGVKLDGAGVNSRRVVIRGDYITWITRITTLAHELREKAEKPSSDEEEASSGKSFKITSKKSAKKSAKRRNVKLPLMELTKIWSALHS